MGEEPGIISPKSRDLNKTPYEVLSMANTAAKADRLSDQLLSERK